MCFFIRVFVPAVGNYSIYRHLIAISIRGAHYLSIILSERP